MVAGANPAGDVAVDDVTVVAVLALPVTVSPYYAPCSNSL